MKKVYLMMVFAFTSAAFSHAQDSSTNEERGNKVNVGVKLGVNYSNIYDIDAESFTADPKFGLATGLFIDIPIGSFLGIQPEILFSQKGYKAEGNILGSPYVITRTSNYIDIPLYLSIKPAEMLTIMAGPQYSFLMSQKNKFENGQTTIDQEKEFDNESIRKNTFCFAGGVDLNLKEFVISGRAGMDLYKNNGDGSTTTPRYRNFWYQLTLGYRF